jgi:hypothetical protein
LIFVGGAPRSGTTLLQHILDCHPEVFGGPEFDCVPALLDAWRELQGALANGRIAVFCTREQIDAAFARLIEALLLPVADANGCRWLSEKTPMNALCLYDLLGLLPHCRGIHIVRDPRAVVASLLQVGSRARAKNAPVPPSLADVQAAVALTLSAVNAACHAQHVFPERMLTLTYESLVQQPKPAIQRVCDFLGLELVPAMLQPHERKHPAQDEIRALDNGVWLDPQLGFRAIETSRIDTWRTQLDADQVDAINAACREHSGYRYLGYGFDN